MCGHEAKACDCLWVPVECHSTEHATLNPFTKLMPRSVLASLLCTLPHLNPVEESKCTPNPFISNVHDEETVYSPGCNFSNFMFLHLA